jgi:hypothetical protein
LKSTTLEKPSSRQEQPVRARVIPVVVLLAVPSVAFAQVGGARPGGRGEDKYAPTNDLPKYPPAAELQKYNPVVYLVDRRKKLSLTDSQVVALRRLQGRIYERNADFVGKYDAAQKIYNPENANDASSLRADSTRTRALGQMALMTAMLDSLMARRQQDDLDALALFTDEKQKKQAAEMLDKQDADFARLMPAGGPRRTWRRP